MLKDVVQWLLGRPRMTNRPLHVVEAVAQHTHTVIFLHGRGSNGPQVATALGIMSTSAGKNIFQHFPGVRWVFPSSQLESSRWFEGLDDATKVPPGLKASIQMLQRVIQDEIRTLGGDAGKVVLGGISQGLAIAFHVLLCGDVKLGAFFGASGWLPLVDKIEQQGDNRTDVNQVSKYLRKQLGLKDDMMIHGRVVETPVFLGHGTFDCVISLERGKQACRILQGLNMDVLWKEYVGADLGGHWFKEPEELDDIVEFMQSSLKDLQRVLSHHPSPLDQTTYSR